MDTVSSHARKYGRSCVTCRHRKVRCDTRKPTCNQCLKSDFRCSYKNDARNTTRSGSTTQTLPENLEVGLANESDTPTSTITSDLSIDESGTVNYYGATSRFHNHSYALVAPGAQATEEQYHRRWLKSNARFQQSWEARAYERLNTDLAQPDIDATVAKLLIEIYWTWQAPLHNCVYRRCFFRDMALGGPYFSKFLLNVIFAHACRHTKTNDIIFSSFQKGEFFLRRAKALLAEELETTKIPTIQGLLILGGRQCAIGKNSEGWLYTSMAIGMVMDLGLHLPKSRAQRMKELEPDDLEARTRLYLSAYAWDKSISLCLGRPPRLREMPYTSQCLLDDLDDTQEWQPVYLCSMGHPYPPTSSYTTLTFSYFCQLTKLVDRLYDEVYESKSNAPAQSARPLELEIRQWYEELPTCLKFDHAAVNICSPPPHILCLNVLYHTLLILLYRPFCQVKPGVELEDELVEHSRKICAEEAALVNTHFQAYGRTFEYRNQTYLLSYCVYTAATIEVQLLRDQDDHVAGAAAERLATTLSMLEVEAAQTPGIRKSVDIIRSKIDSMPKRGVSTLARQDELTSLVSNHDTSEIGATATEKISTALHTRQVSVSNRQELAEFDDQNMELNDIQETPDMPWFDWNAFDISGGFPIYDDSTWASQLPMWHSNG